MLPSDLLSHRTNGEEIVPQRLALQPRTLTLASELIADFQSMVGRTQGELDAALAEREADRTDYRVQRGLVHLLKTAFSQFEVVSPLEPIALRRRVFAAAVGGVPGPALAKQMLNQVAGELGSELGRAVGTEELRAALYADLPENRILTSFEAPTNESLLHRYNLAQVQGALYRATHLILHAHRNDPGEYKLLFRYLKLFGLMTYIEGDADHGYTLTIDGPASLFQPSTRYGLALAKLLPALLHVTKWNLMAELVTRPGEPDPAPKRFRLAAECGLVSHYPPGKPFDSMVEASFAKSWDAVRTEWMLHREVDLIPIPGSVMIPDFRLAHPDGRAWLLEIVGYWRPEYLRKKFAQVRQAGRQDLVLAVSDRLNLERAGVSVQDLPGKVVWFKERLTAAQVLGAIGEA